MPSKRCNSCNAELKPGGKYCSECGTPIVGDKCANCGAELKSGSKYCADCGTPVTEGSPVVPAVGKGPVRITISYSLGNMQGGRAVVGIDGREVGTLSVSKQHSSSTIEVTLPRPGTYSYAVQAKMTVSGYRPPQMKQLVAFEAESAGEGSIEVEAGKQFVLTTDTVLLTSGSGGRGNRYVANLEDSAPPKPDSLRRELQGIVDEIRAAHAKNDSQDIMFHELSLIGAMEGGLVTLGLDKEEFDRMGVDVDLLVQWLSKGGWIR